MLHVFCKFYRIVFLVSEVEDSAEYLSEINRKQNTSK